MNGRCRQRAYRDQLEGSGTWLEQEECRAQPASDRLTTAKPCTRVMYRRHQASRGCVRFVPCMQRSCEVVKASNSGS